MKNRRLVILFILVLALSAVSFTMSMAEGDIYSDLGKPENPPGQGEDYTAGFGLILSRKRPWMGFLHHTGILQRLQTASGDQPAASNYQNRSY